MMKSTRDTIMTVLKADPSVTREEREGVEVALGGRVRPKVRMYTEKDAADVLGVSKSTVARMKREGTLRTVRIHKGKRISAESVEAVCAGRLSTETKTTKENR